MNITNIPAPRVPFIDERTGLMAREWYRFFLNLFVLTGSGNNPITLEELQLGPPNQPDLAELLIQINQNIAPQYEDQSGDFLATLDTAQLMSMMSQFANAEAAIQGAYLQPVVQTGTIANYNLDGSPTAGGIAYGTGPALAVSAAGTLGQVLTSAGAGTPTWAAAATGTVTSVSVVSANGLAGTVATATTTPAITLSTTITGLLKGNGTAISAATSGTDYAPATSGTSILYGNGAGGFSNVTIGTGVAFAGGTLSATGSGGTVTSVTGTAPVVSSGGTTPAISMAAATTSVNGYLTSTDWTTFNNKGSGSVTSVAQSFTGGLISVAGSPITTSGTLALTVAGTSGGIPYFSSASTWATSAALTASALIVGGGAGAAPATTTTGTGVVTALGVNTGTAGAFVVNGGALGTPSSGVLSNLTGTLNAAIVSSSLTSVGTLTNLSLDASAEKVLNGTDWTGASGATPPTNWSAIQTDTTNSVAGGVSGNALSMSYVGGVAIIEQVVATTSGHVYQASFYIKSGTSGNELAILYDNSGAFTVSGTTSASWVQYTGIFVAIGASVSLRVRKNTATAGTMLFDSVSITEIPLTVNGPAYVNGTLIATKVGIGTTTPNYSLEISTDSAGKPGIGGLWTVVSDERIKADIVPANLDRCYEIVKSVPLKYFGFAPNVYTDDQINDKHNLGWIAQDVQKVFKNSVSVKPFTLKTGDVIEDCLDLNGGQMIAALYGAVQSLIEKVEAQANIIRKLS